MPTGSDREYGWCLQVQHKLSSMQGLSVYVDSDQPLRQVQFSAACVALLGLRKAMADTGYCVGWQLGVCVLLQ